MSGGNFHPLITSFSAVKFFALKALFKRTSTKFNLKIFKLTFKPYDPFLWMGFNRLNATEPLRGGILLFTTKLPETPGTYLIDFLRMKG